MQSANVLNETSLFCGCNTTQPRKSLLKICRTAARKSEQQARRLFGLPRCSRLFGLPRGPNLKLLVHFSDADQLYVLSSSEHGQTVASARAPLARAGQQGQHDSQTRGARRCLLRRLQPGQCVDSECQTGKRRLPVALVPQFCCVDLHPLSRISRATHSSPRQDG